MHRNRNLTAVLSLALLAFASGTRADDLSEKGRDVFNRNQRAVVTAEVVLKLTSEASGRSREFKQDVTGTVLDPSGLTVLALSSCDPTELSRRLYENPRAESEVSDIKILLEDGTELPAEIVLRDKDQDLAFIRPKTKPPTPLTAVDLTQSGRAEVLDQVITINRLNKASSRAYSASVERITAVVQKPRTFYLPDSTKTATSLGSPAFLPNGKMLGVIVMRSVRMAGSDSGDVSQNIASIILPAEDILKAAKQAPEAKPESEKKEEPKDSKDSK